MIQIQKSEKSEQYSCAPKCRFSLSEFPEQIQAKPYDNGFVKYSKRNIRNEYFAERIKFDIRSENPCLIECEE